MGKYIDAEKLIANLERQNVDKKVIEPVIRIINSFQQEQQEVDLEEEITNFIQAHYHIRYDNTLENGNDPLTVFDFEDIARHFAEWGAEHLRDTTKMIDKGLKEAAEEFAEGEWDGVAVDTDGNPLYAQDEIEYAFKAGAEWQKSQMLKDAYVESQIVEDGRIELEGDPLPCLNPIILLPYPQFKPYDKVRIVVLKEEE